MNAFSFEGAPCSTWAPSEGWTAAAPREIKHVGEGAGFSPRSTAQNHAFLTVMDAMIDWARWERPDRWANAINVPGTQFVAIRSRAYQQHAYVQ